MKYRPAILLLATGLCFLLGCVKLPLRKPAQVPKLLPEHYASQLRPIHTHPRTVSEELIECRGTYDVMLYKIESYVALWGTNRLLELECTIPHGASQERSILILPISGGGSYPLERPWLAPYFTRNGFITVLVRRYKIEKNLMDPKMLNSIILQSVLDNRLVLDWMEARPEFDTNRICGVGTSLGSMKLGLLMACDDRIKAGVMVLTGCDAPYIMTYSKDGAFRGGGVTMRRNKYLLASGLNHQQFFELMHKSIDWDLTKDKLGPCIDSKKALLIIGSCDFVVPFKKGLELRRAIGKPETGVFIGGHYSSAFYIFYIRHSALEFLERKLGEK